MARIGNTFPLRMPKSIRRRGTEMARLEGVSLNLFIAIAVAEKIVRTVLASDDKRFPCTESPKDATPYRTP